MAEAIADPTDPRTPRPNIPPEIVIGAVFQPLDCPEFSSRINLPPTVPRDDPFPIFSLFIPLVRKLRGKYLFLQ